MPNTLFSCSPYSSDYKSLNPQDIKENNKKVRIVTENDMITILASPVVV